MGTGPLLYNLVTIAPVLIALRFAESWKSAHCSSKVKGKRFNAAKWMYFKYDF